MLHYYMQTRTRDAGLPLVKEWTRMAYLDHDHTHKRLAGLTGVALVHLALAAGLTLGLGIQYVQEKERDILDGGQIPIPPPPTPTDTPEATDDPVPLDPTTAPVPPIPFPVPTTIPVLPTDEDSHDDDVIPTGGTGDVEQPRPFPSPSPTPGFTPRGPVPANSSATWVTTDDYPRSALSREYEGTTGYQLDVDTNGRVSACRVTSSSGYAVLDDAACTRITRRARFRPATDRTGSEVAGTWRGSVTWQIPD